MSFGGNIRDTAAELDDGWIWGSSRGGGGAPLKDRSGKAITNLKLVIQGDVEPDHSPSHSPNKDPFALQGTGGGRGGRGGGGGMDFDEYDDEPRGQYRRSNGRTPRGGYDDDYNDMPRNNRGEKPRRLRFQDDGGDDNEQDIYGSGGNRRGGRRNAPRRNNDYDDYHEPRTSRRNSMNRSSPNRHTSPIDRGSPNGQGKPVGQAIREMYKSELPEHREMRTKKELSYQNELKAQIEEKQRKKDMEQLKLDQLKQKELEEYLTVHYKGSVPSHVSSKVRKQRQELQDREKKLNRLSDYDDNDFGSSFTSSSGGGDKGKSLVLDDVVGSGGGRGARPGRRVPRDYSPEDDRDRAFDDPPIAPRRSSARSPGIRRAPRDDEDDDASMPSSARDKNFHKKWVPQSEYDELSALCDNLLRQQDELQSELVNVKHAKGGARGGPAAARRGVTNTNNNPRARSQQQLHREQARPKQNGPGTFGSSRTRSSQSTRSNPTTSARETRENNRGGSAASTVKKGGGKVAFGRAIVPSAPSKRQELASKGGGVAKVRGGESVGARGAQASRKVPPLFKGSGRNVPKAGRRPMDDDDYDVPPAGPRGGGGFQRLAQKTKVKGEPVIVSYDDEGREPPPGPRGGSRGRASVELNGESEYLKIGGEEVDIISGDQLDRLLVQARGARAADY